MEIPIVSRRSIYFEYREKQQFKKTKELALKDAVTMLLFELFRMDSVPDNLEIKVELKQDLLDYQYTVSAYNAE